MLFVDRAIAVEPSFELTDANAAAVAEICTQPRRHPPGHRARRGPGATAGASRHRRPPRRPLRPAQRAGAGPRPGTRRCGRSSSGPTTCSSDDDRRLLARLSVFHDGFDLPAADGGRRRASRPCGRRRTVAALAGLVERSLVQVHHGRDDPLLAARDDPLLRRRPAVRAGRGGRHPSRTPRLGASASPAPPRPSWAARAGTTANARLTAEQANLRAALGWALDGAATRQPAASWRPGWAAGGSSPAATPRAGSSSCGRCEPRRRGLPGRHPGPAARGRGLVRLPPRRCGRGREPGPAGPRGRAGGRRRAVPGRGRLPRRLGADPARRPRLVGRGRRPGAGAAGRRRQRGPASPAPSPWRRVHRCCSATSPSSRATWPKRPGWAAGRWRSPAPPPAGRTSPSPSSARPIRRWWRATSTGRRRCSTRRWPPPRPAATASPRRSLTTSGHGCWHCGVRWRRPKPRRPAAGPPGGPAGSGSSARWRRWPRRPRPSHATDAAGAEAALATGGRQRPGHGVHRLRAHLARRPCLPGRPPGRRRGGHRPHRGGRAGDDRPAGPTGRGDRGLHPGAAGLAQRGPAAGGAARPGGDRRLARRRRPPRRRRRRRGAGRAGLSPAAAGRTASGCWPRRRPPASGSATGAPGPAACRDEAAAAIDGARRELGDDAVAALTEEGSAMSLEDAVAYASRGSGGRKRPDAGWASLTPTEVQVVRLVAEGLRNDTIADPPLPLARHREEPPLPHLHQARRDQPRRTGRRGAAPRGVTRRRRVVTGDRRS